MSQCVSCSNQPNTNDSLGGAAHEGTVTPMVVGIIVGTVIVFIIVVCLLFYCVKLENHRYMAKVGDESLPADEEDRDGAGASGEQPCQQLGTDRPEGPENIQDVSREMSVKSRPSSVVVIPQSSEVTQVGNAAGGKKRLVFGWGKKRNSNGQLQMSILVCTFKNGAI